MSPTIDTSPKTCPNCGTEFGVKNWELRSNKRRKYCSHPCQRAHIGTVLQQYEGGHENQHRVEVNFEESQDELVQQYREDHDTTYVAIIRQAVHTQCRVLSAGQPEEIRNFRPHFISLADTRRRGHVSEEGWRLITRIQNQIKCPEVAPIVRWAVDEFLWEEGY